MFAGMDILVEVKHWLLTMTTQQIFFGSMLYLMRHGAIESTAEKRFVGQIDPPLSPDGRKQAERQGRQLMDIPFTGLWCSDLTRSRETAAIVSVNLGIKILQAPELREIDLGQWDGMAISQIRKHFPDLWQARGEDFGHFRPPGAESFADLQQRAVPFIRRIAVQSPGNTLIVTHAGVIRVLLCEVLQIPLANLFRIHLDYGGITLIQDINGKSRVMAVNLSPCPADNIT
jgi:alpha-ribazole phosphatase